MLIADTDISVLDCHTYVDALEHSSLLQQAKPRDQTVFTQCSDCQVLGDQLLFPSFGKLNVLIKLQSAMRDDQIQGGQLQPKQLRKCQCQCSKTCLPGMCWKGHCTMRKLKNGVKSGQL